MKLAVPMIAILLLVGCSKPKDVAYYKSHPAERGKRVGECMDYSDASDDCVNAKQAQLEAYGIPAKDGEPIVK